MHYLLFYIMAVDAVPRRFAGVHAEKAVVEPEARAMLTSFDASVTHFEVVHGPERQQGK